MMALPWAYAGAERSCGTMDEKHCQGNKYWPKSWDRQDKFGKGLSKQCGQVWGGMKRHARQRQRYGQFGLWERQVQAKMRKRGMMAKGFNS